MSRAKPSALKSKSRDVLTFAGVPYTLVVESQVVMPSLIWNWDYFSVDNIYGVSRVQCYAAQKSEGTPGHWDSYRFAELFIGGIAGQPAMLYFAGRPKSDQLRRTRPRGLA
jgi:hypothetical protein